MSSWANGRIRSGGVAVLLLFVAVSCTGDDDASDTAATSVPSSEVDGDSLTPNSGVVSAPTTVPLPDCDGDAVTVPADWPFGVADVIVPTRTSRDGELFLVQGVTNQPESALISTMDSGFPGFDVSEPTGGDNDISVSFTSIDGSGDLRMSDNDTDGCWDVELAALLEPGAAPPLAEGAGTASDDDTTASAGTQPDGAPTTATGSDNGDVPAVASTVAPPEVLDPLDQINAVGTGEVITGRSTYQVQVTMCSMQPLRIEAVAVGGLLVIEGDPSGVTTTWTYDDGEVITSNESKVLGLDERGGSVVADGQNAQGPETIFATFLCTEN